MQDYILKGVVLRAIDLKEKDKLITIFTAEKGIISASLRGVRQQKSKLKFATQPMCFAEFSLTGNGEILTCTNASEIESFFAITQDYDKMVYASAMLEMIYSTAYKEPNVGLFVSLVRALGGLCDNNLNSGVVFAKYCLQFFASMGYGLNLDSCKTCGKKFEDSLCLDLNSGALICKSHAGFDAIDVSKECYKLLWTIDDYDFAELEKVKANEEQIKKCTTLFVYNFNALF
ncbi:MAG: DNA repair protein RecO, partial [Clostridia bacterium]|nr:DNA repair protein RecO [Clostridia bacterium]